MLNAEYTRRINKSYFILNKKYNDGECDMGAVKEDQDSIEMFRHNKIANFLCMEAQKKDIKYQFCYDITGRRSLGQMLEYKLADYELIQRILDSFDQACMMTENYMLSENDILLNPEFVFFESDAEQLFFCYFPGYQVDICRQFKEFVEYLLSHLEHKDEKAVQLAYGVHQQVVVNQESLHVILRNKNQIQRQFPDPSADLEKEQKVDYDFKEEREDTRSKNTYRQDRETKPDNGLEQRSEISLQQEQLMEPLKKRASWTTTKQVAEKLKHMLCRKLYTDRARHIEEPAVFEADDEEEVITNNPTVCLMPEASGKTVKKFVYQGADRSRDFECSEGMMILGSDRKESDIYIPLPMISRVHARIETNVKGTYLEDMNSTNGTQVNGELLRYRERRLLHQGDIVNLAGECYSFH